MPALDVTGTLGKLTVRATAKKGVFPAGTKIRLKAAEESKKSRIRLKPLWSDGSLREEIPVNGLRKGNPMRRKSTKEILAESFRESGSSPG